MCCSIPELNMWSRPLELSDIEKIYPDCQDEPVDRIEPPGAIVFKRQKPEYSKLLPGVIVFKQQ